MSVSKQGAVAAALAVIRGIAGTGSGHKTNLEGRAYGRLILPIDPEESIARPYVCLPLDQEGETVEYAGMGFTSKWIVTGYAFFDDNIASDKLDSSGAVAANDFRDDVIASFMRDQYLGGQVLDVEAVSFDTAAASDGDPTTWLIFRVQFTQFGGADDLLA